MVESLTKIARENFRAGRYLSSASREQPSRWTYGGLPRSVSSGRNAVDRILQRRAAAQSAHSGSTGICRNLFAKLTGR